LAGKFGEICTAFPLTTFSAKNSKWLPLQFPAKNYLNITCCKKVESKTPICFLPVKKSEKDILTSLLSDEISPKHLSFSNSFAPDDVSDDNLYPPILVCNTGQNQKRQEMYPS